MRQLRKQVAIGTRMRPAQRSFVILAMLWLFTRHVLCEGQQSPAGPSTSSPRRAAVWGVPTIKLEFYELQPIDGGYHLGLRHPDGFERIETVLFDPQPGQLRLRGHLHLPFDGRGQGGEAKVATLNYELDHHGGYSMRYRFASVGRERPTTAKPTVKPPLGIEFPKDGVFIDVRLGATSLKTLGG